MGNLIKGEVVVVPFPFSDLSNSKRRPALVLADLPGKDVILCQITSQNVSIDNYAVSVSNSDFESGALPASSRIRPNKIFTADTSIIMSKAGKISNSKLCAVADKLREIFTLT